MSYKQNQNQNQNQNNNDRKTFNFKSFVSDMLDVLDDNDDNEDIRKERYEAVAQLQRMNYHVSRLPGSPICPGAPLLAPSQTLPSILPVISLTLPVTVIG